MRHSDESSEEWMGRLKVKATDCKYKDGGRNLKEQFINGTNDQAMTAEIMKELTIIKEHSKIITEQILSWVKRIEVQHSQKSMLENSKETKDFKIIRKSKH